MATRIPSSSGGGGVAPDFGQAPEKNVSNAARVVVRDYGSVQERNNISITEPQISFSSLMSTAELEAHKLSFDQVDLPLTHPEILVFCQSYAMVDPSFVPKLTSLDVASRYLVLMGVGKIMGMFLAFHPGQIPQAVHQYMLSLEKLTSLVVKALGFELPLLHKIVINSQSVTQQLLSRQVRDQLMCRLKRRRSSAAELVMGNRSMELLLKKNSMDGKETGPSV